MVKHTQTIVRQIADELFACVWPFFAAGTQRVKFRLYLSFIVMLNFVISIDQPLKFF